eukprot:1141738-Pelagomonas_calceolata.AAC.4
MCSHTPIPAPLCQMPGGVAKAYRELGAVLMEDKHCLSTADAKARQLTCMAKDHMEGMGSCLSTAYTKACQHACMAKDQEKAYADKPASLDVARAECYKLKGNIYVAQSHLRRAHADMFMGPKASK